MAADGFIHLRVRSAYSLLEGAIKAGKLGTMAAAERMPAVGIADRANLFGALEFSQACKDAGVQPLVGCALPVTGIGERGPERWARAPTVALYAQNAKGWRNLMALSSMAYLEEGVEPCVAWSEVVAHNEGLITGRIAGLAKDTNEKKKYLEFLKKLSSASADGWTSRNDSWSEKMRARRVQINYVIELAVTARKYGVTAVE